MKQPNVHTETGVEQAEREAKEQRERELDEMRTVASTKAGRSFLHRYLAHASVFKGTFVSGAPDASAWNEGKRDVGLRLFLELIEACPESYSEMMREAAIVDAEKKAKEDERSKHYRKSESEVYRGIADPFASAEG